MKIRLASLLVLVATLNAFVLSPLSAASLENIPYGFVVQKANPSATDEIEHGASFMTVRRLLGSPSRKLSDDVWIYTGYHPELSDAAKAYGCDTLVITFVEGKVADLKIVNTRATKVIAANLKRNTAAMQVAKK